MKVEKTALMRIKRYIEFGAKGAVLKRVKFDLEKNFHWNDYSAEEIDAALETLRENHFKVDRRGSKVVIIFRNDEEHQKFLDSVKVVISSDRKR